MKNIFYLIIALIEFFSCKKPTGYEAPVFSAKACFKLLANNIYVDSVVQFINCSDSVNIVYRWDFGDGSTSTEQSPKHIYKKNGDYLVTLTTFLNSEKKDSTSVTVKVVNDPLAKVKIGERYFDLLRNTIGFDFAECLDSSIIVVGTTWDVEDPNVDDEDEPFILKLDKNLNKKWIKYLDIKSNPGINSIERLSDGNFIISRAIDKPDHGSNFSLCKIDSSGNIIWSKNYQGTNGYCKYATEAKDGGIIGIGTEYQNVEGVNIKLVSVVKTDADGNLQWKRAFIDNWLMDANNIISVPDGYIFASSTRGTNAFYTNSHDSLIITKIGLDNKTIWKKSKEWQIPGTGTVFEVWSTSLALNSKHIVAVNEANPFIMVFDLEGNFLKRNYNLSGEGIYKFILPTVHENFIIGGGEQFWDHIELTGLDFEGAKVWNTNYGNRYPECYDERGYGTKAKSLLDRNYLYLGVSYKMCASHGDCSMFMTKINEAGEIQ